MQEETNMTHFHGTYTALVTPFRNDRVDLDALRAGLVERGATIVGGGRQGPHEWVTYADPEGNEFCILRTVTPDDAS